MDQSNEIETLRDGTFAYYLKGKHAYQLESGRVYITLFQSDYIDDLKKAIRLKKWTARWGVMLLLLPFLISGPNQLLIDASITVQLLTMAILISSRFQVFMLAFWLPKVKYVEQTVDPKVARDFIRVQESQRSGPLMRFLPPLLFAALITFAWTMIVHHRGDGLYWPSFLTLSPYLVLAASCLTVLCIYSFFPAAKNIWRFEWLFFPAYLFLAFSWSGLLTTLKISIYYGATPIVYKQNLEQPVEWRIEIARDEEPKTWPFKESSYMLGCLGYKGDYGVYLVKRDDITYKPNRPKSFVPEYYRLKGNSAWKDAKSQLLPGQSDKVFQQYIDRSEDFCRKAEAARASATQK